MHKTFGLALSNTMVAKKRNSRQPERGIIYEKGKGEFGRAREKGKERLQGDHCFLHFHTQILSVKIVIGQN